LLLFLGELGGHALAWAVPNFYNMDHFIGWQQALLGQPVRVGQAWTIQHMLCAPVRVDVPKNHNVWDICGCARPSCAREALMDSGVGG
jgi:hypothetical protein